MAPKIQQHVQLTAPKDRRPRQLTIDELAAFVEAAKLAGVPGDRGVCARAAGFGARLTELWADTGENGDAS